MLIDHLHIKNVALIESADIAFGAGLSIVSGETGAGKSMLIDAVNFVLGERVGKDFIRGGEDMAQVEAMLSIGHADVAKAIGDMGVTLAEDNALLLSRTINRNGQSVCKMNGKTVTLGMLKEISALLVDIHGQHEHQSLLNATKHMTLLDKFCGEALEALKLSLGESIKAYKDISKQMATLSGNETERAAKVSLLSFQRDEIYGAKLKDGEEETLLERRKKLSHLERLTDNAFEALALLSEQEGEQMTAAAQLDKVLHLLSDIGNIDESQAYLAEAAEAVLAQVSEIVHDLKSYTDDLEHDPRELADIEARLDLIYGLKRKYGDSIADILAHGEQVTAQLDFIENSAGKLAELTQQKKKNSMEIMAVCADMSQLRKRFAKDITAQIVAVLQELGMKDAQFDIVIERKKEFGNSGYDRVQFLISPNPGEPLKPLADIASGGEMSRVMLALKTVLADADQIETFIFDEIDAGVSGVTAQKVGEKLAFIGKKHQILCITHLPQIAAMGDSHFLIEKKVQESRTTTHVAALDYDGSVKELARLIGGAKITDVTMKAATELKLYKEALI